MRNNNYFPNNRLALKIIFQKPVFFFLDTKKQRRRRKKKGIGCVPIDASITTPKQKLQGWP
jgi:hypothetical protein